MHTKFAGKRTPDYKTLPWATTHWTGWPVRRAAGSWPARAEGLRFDAGSR